MRAIEFAAVKIVAAVVSALPMPIVRSLGASIGRMAYRVDRTHRRVATDNLAAAFPTRSDADRRALAQAMFAHFGSLLLELLKFSTYTREQMVAAVDVEGDERVLNA